MLIRNIFLHKVMSTRSNYLHSDVNLIVGCMYAIDDHHVVQTACVKKVLALLHAAKHCLAGFAAS